MTSGEKKQVMIMNGLWTTPSSPGGKPQLLGSECLSCGQLFFPRNEKGLCINCRQRNLQDIKLSGRGRIASFSVVMQQPGGGFYKGPVPYAYGYVDLPDGIRVETLFSCEDFGQLKVGMDVELVIEKLCDDECNEIITYKFRPVGIN